MTAPIERDVRILKEKVALLTGEVGSGVMAAVRRGDMNPVEERILSASKSLVTARRMKDETIITRKVGVREITDTSVAYTVGAITLNPGGSTDPISIQSKALASAPRGDVIISGSAYIVAGVAAVATTAGNNLRIVYQIARIRDDTLEEESISSLQVVVPLYNVFMVAGDASLRHGGVIPFFGVDNSPLRVPVTYRLRVSCFSEYPEYDDEVTASYRLLQLGVLKR